MLDKEREVLIAKVLCNHAGLMLEDDDGSSNWMMFCNDAAAVLESVRKRFPTSTTPPK